MNVHMKILIMYLCITAHAYALGLAATGAGGRGVPAKETEGTQTAGLQVTQHNGNDCAYHSTTIL